MFSALITRFCSFTYYHKADNIRMPPAKTTKTNPAERWDVPVPCKNVSPKHDFTSKWLFYACCRVPTDPEKLHQEIIFPFRATSDHEDKQNIKTAWFLHKTNPCRAHFKLFVTLSQETWLCNSLKQPLWYNITQVWFYPRYRRLCVSSPSARANRRARLAL